MKDAKLILKVSLLSILFIGFLIWLSCCSLFSIDPYDFSWEPHPIENNDTLPKDNNADENKKSTVYKPEVEQNEKKAIKEMTSSENKKKAVVPGFTTVESSQYNKGIAKKEWIEPFFIKPQQVVMNSDDFQETPKKIDYESQPEIPKHIDAFFEDPGDITNDKLYQNNTHKKGGQKLTNNSIFHEDSHVSNEPLNNDGSEKQ